jgi:predicted oxidoreductase
MLWGFWGKEMTKAKRIELMENAYDVGISSFDYADIYGNYNTENDFGTAFSESGLLGDKLQFISKCGIAMTCGNKPYKPNITITVQVILLMLFIILYGI